MDELGIEIFESVSRIYDTHVTNTSVAQLGAISHLMLSNPNIFIAVMDAMKVRLAESFLEAIKHVLSGVSTNISHQCMTQKEFTKYTGVDIYKTSPYNFTGFALECHEFLSSFVPIADAIYNSSKFLETPDNRHYFGLYVFNIFMTFIVVKMRSFSQIHKTPSHLVDFVGLAKSANPVRVSNQP